MPRVFYLWSHLKGDRFSSLVIASYLVLWSGNVKRLSVTLSLRNRENVKRIFHPDLSPQIGGKLAD
jgi:hypothetical protein